MPKFLIVDDSPTVRLFLKSSIRNILGDDALFTETDNGQDAVARFRSEKPDVVLLDMVLGGGSYGGDVMRAILKTDASARIILVTSLPPSDPKVVEAIAQGAFAYLPKPARTQAIRQVLADIDIERGDSGPGGLS